jgi:hypothetical protein
MTTTTTEPQAHLLCPCTYCVRQRARREQPERTLWEKRLPAPQQASDSPLELPSDQKKACIQ